MRLVVATFSGLTLDFVHLVLWLQHQSLRRQRVLRLKSILRVFFLIFYSYDKLNLLLIWTASQDKLADTRDKPNVNYNQIRVF